MKHNWYRIHDYLCGRDRNCQFEFGFEFEFGRKTTIFSPLLPPRSTHRWVHQIGSERRWIIQSEIQPEIFNPRYSVARFNKAKAILWTHWRNAGPRRDKIRWVSTKNLSFEFQDTLSFNLNFKFWVSRYTEFQHRIQDLSFETHWVST